MPSPAVAELMKRFGLTEQQAERTLETYTSVALLPNVREDRERPQYRPPEEPYRVNQSISDERGYKARPWTDWGPAPEVNYMTQNEYGTKYLHWSAPNPGVHGGGFLLIPSTSTILSGRAQAPAGCTARPRT